MLWIILALGAHFLWAIVNLGDKYIMSKKITNPLVYFFWFWLVGCIIGLLLAPWIGFYVPSAKYLILIFITSLAYALGGLPYLMAMKIEEPTRINVWWNLIPIFTLIGEWFILHQGLSQMQLVAFVILIIGAFVASIHAGEKKFAVSRAALLMILSCAAYSVYVMIFDYVLLSVPFAVAFVWLVIFMFFCSLFSFFSKRVRTDWLASVKLLRGRALFLTVLIISILDFGGIFLNVWALSLGHPALVFAFEGSQVLMVFLLATLITKYAPHIIKEKLDWKNVALKLAAIVIMVLGVIVLALA